MQPIIIILIVIACYYLLVFVLTRNFIPHYGWKKSPLPSTISDQIQREIDALKKAAPSPDMFLRATYELIARRYAPTFTVFFHVPALFIVSPERLWNRKGRYLACHQLNLLVRVFLVKSGYFPDESIRIRYTITEGVMTHQYLQVLTDGDWVDVDPWGLKYKIPFGKHASGFVAPIPPRVIPHHR